MGNYNVVYEYTANADGLKGNRVFTSYDSKADFEAQRAKDDSGLEIVIAQGISIKEAQSLCAAVSAGVVANGVIELSKGADREVNPLSLQVNLANAILSPVNGERE